MRYPAPFKTSWYPWYWRFLESGRLVGSALTGESRLPSTKFPLSLSSTQPARAIPVDGSAVTPPLFEIPWTFENLRRVFAKTCRVSDLTSTKFPLSLSSTQPAQATPADTGKIVIKAGKVANKDKCDVTICYLPLRLKWSHLTARPQ